MWQRYTFYDFRVIAHYLGVLLTLVGIGMIVPLVVAFATKEWEPAHRYLFSVGLALTLGSALRMARIEPGRLNRQQAIAITSFAWLAAALMGAVPLVMSNHYGSYLDALFDAMALFTTTGASIVSQPDHLSYADSIWRLVTMYSGGLGLVVVAMSFGVFGAVTDSSLYDSEGHSEHVLPNVVQTAQFTIKLSLAVIGAASVVLVACMLAHGMTLARSLFHGVFMAVSSFMTVGLSPNSTNVAYYHSVVIEVVLMVLMLLGSINFSLQSEVIKGRIEAFLHDMEIRSGALWIMIMLAIFAASIAGVALLSNAPTMLRMGLFTFVSASTTAGFATLTSNQLNAVFPSGALLVLAIAMAIGGSSGSTSGGIKLRRIVIIGKSAIETMKITASPDSARIQTSYYHIGRMRLGAAEVKEAMTVFIMFVLVYIVGALAGIALGYDAVDALMESIAMASNGGMSAGITSAGMPIALKVIYIAEMWAGRLEFVTLLAVGIKILVSCKPRLASRAQKGDR